MYNDSREGDSADRLKTNIFYVKIFIIICTLALGAYVTLWSIGIIDNLINNTENVPIFKTILDLTSQQNSFTVTYNEKRLVIENNDAFKFAFFLLILIVLFNIVGKAIAGIFRCLASVVGSMNVTSGKQPNDASNKRL